MVITVAVVGASRRFLTQITRHQNEVKYMSASLQYSNYSGHAAFAIPYEILKAEENIQELYTKSCQSDLNNYENSALPESVMMLLDMRHHKELRNVLIISRNPLSVETYDRAENL